VFDNGAVLDPLDFNWEYQLWSNSSVGRSNNNHYPYDTIKGADPLYAKYKQKGRLVALHKLINDALISLDLPEGGPTPSKGKSVGITLGPYPEQDGPNDRQIVQIENQSDIEPPNIMLYLGCPIVMIGVTAVAILSLMAIVDEKRTRVLGHLRSMGLNEATYWLSWMLALFPIGLVHAIIATAVGNLTGLDVFTKCSFGVHVVALTLYD
jgi:hypothetical protein